MVLVAFCIDFVAVGFFFYSYGVFFKAIAEDFGGSRLGVAIGLTVTNAVGALLRPMSAVRWTNTRCATSWALVPCSWLSVSSVCPSCKTSCNFTWCWVCLSGLGPAAGNLATSKLVTNWFDSAVVWPWYRRGRGVVVRRDHAVHQRRVDRERLASGFLIYSAFTFLVGATDFRLGFSSRGRRPASGWRYAHETR